MFLIVGVMLASFVAMSGCLDDTAEVDPNDPFAVAAVEEDEGEWYEGDWFYYLVAVVLMFVSMYGLTLLIMIITKKGKELSKKVGMIEFLLALVLGTSVFWNPSVRGMIESLLWWGGYTIIGVLFLVFGALVFMWFMFGAAGIGLAVKANKGAWKGVKGGAKEASKDVKKLSEDVRVLLEGILKRLKDVRDHLEGDVDEEAVEDAKEEVVEINRIRKEIDDKIDEIDDIVAEKGDADDRKLVSDLKKKRSRFRRTFRRIIKGINNAFDAIDKFFEKKKTKEKLEKAAAGEDDPDKKKKLKDASEGAAKDMEEAKEEKEKDVEKVDARTKQAMIITDNIDEDLKKVGAMAWEEEAKLIEHTPSPQLTYDVKSLGERKKELVKDLKKIAEHGSPAEVIKARAKATEEISKGIKKISAAVEKVKASSTEDLPMLKPIEEELEELEKDLPELKPVNEAKDAVRDAGEQVRLLIKYVRSNPDLDNSSVDKLAKNMFDSNRGIDSNREQKVSIARAALEKVSGELTKLNLTSVGPWRKARVAVNQALVELRKAE